MATTTPNFGWSVPTSTDLVKDGATAIETLGDSIDASLVDLKGGTTGQVLAKASNTDMDFVWSADAAGMTNPMTTTGDTIYSSSGSTPARRAIGTTGQVLTVSGGVPTWATPAGASLTWTLLNAGGTNLTGAATVTVSGISAKNNLMILVTDASSASAGANIWIRVNTDSGSNYYYAGPSLQWESAYDAGDIGASTNAFPGGTGFYFGRMSNNANSSVNGYMRLEGCNSGDLVSAFWAGGGVVGGSSQNGHHSKMQGGFYDSSATVTSISVHSDFGNLDAGKVYVYGA